MALLTDLVIWGMEQGGLTSTIPTEIGTMTNLVFIDFDFNELTGPLVSRLNNNAIAWLWLKVEDCLTLTCYISLLVFFFLTSFDVH